MNVRAGTGIGRFLASLAGRIVRPFAVLTPAGRLRFLSFVLVPAALLFASLPAVALAVPPANDNFVNAEILSGDSVTLRATNVDATKEAGEPDHAGDVGGASVWYRWTAPFDGTLSVNCAPDFIILVGIYTGSSVSALTEVASAFGTCGLQPSVTGGTTYQLAIDGSLGDSGTFDFYLNFTRPPLPPPVFTGTDPPSPADNNFPLIKGIAEPGSEVELFDQGMCLGSPMAVGSAATFAAPGIQVYVPDNSSADFFARAKLSGRQSECVGPITYDEVTVPACPPPELQSGATYRGSHSQGGTVCFTVTANWSHVTSFLVVNDDCNFFNQIPISPLPVATGTRSFGRAGRLGGSFDTGRGAAGTYRDQLGGCDTGVVSWNASTTATPPWMLPPPIAAAADKTAPALRLRARSSQRALRQKGIVIEVQCPTEACTATAQGTVSVPSAARTYRLKSATKQIPRGGKAKLKLRLSKKAFKAVRRALSKRKKVKARVTVTVKDAAGNAATKKRSIRLKR
jgi:hypothetical protein